MYMESLLVIRLSLYLTHVIMPALCLLPDVRPVERSVPRALGHLS